METNSEAQIKPNRSQDRIIREQFQNLFREEQPDENATKIEKAEQVPKDNRVTPGVDISGSDSPQSSIYISNPSEYDKSFGKNQNNLEDIPKFEADEEGWTLYDGYDIIGRGSDKECRR